MLPGYLTFEAMSGAKNPLHSQTPGTGQPIGVSKGRESDQC